ncbi:MAG TPA: hypothetical protein PKJ99_16985 [Thermoanaerobaculales bacterium]|nr:hypothetical protein [Thermoanaerobaculales bacterium]HPA80803.1 hypothetical protein [Thermoanaerobaculales bacterium]HQL30093.1 hypothetical protein [Thermoanaerobaculales bacterium]HQP42485.1 hypothetical protein [Thermoanaerobaculales bacterium]
MARILRPLLAIAALLVVAVVAVLALRSCRGPAPPATPAASFSASDVPVESPDLPLEVTTVRGELHDGYMDWACLVRCKDPGGCSADLRATVHYRSAGADEQMTLSGPIDVPIGARVRLGGVQRPPRRVDSVERVTIRVVRSFAPGDPVPTPEI